MAVLIQSVTRALNILEVLTKHPDGLSVKDIAAQVGLNVSTTHHLVNTLEAENYVARLPNGTYGLGLAIPDLYRAFLQSFKPDARLLEAFKALAKTTRETTYISAWQNGNVVIQDIVEGSQALRVGGLHVGFVGHAHARASGKLMLAYLDEEHLDNYLSAHPMTALTPNTLHTAPKLKAHLKSVVEQGYAVDHEEFAEGVCCVAAPIFRTKGEPPMAALSISVPAWRFTQNEKDLISAVVNAARAASAAIGYPGSR